MGDEVPVPEESGSAEDAEGAHTFLGGQLAISDEQFQKLWMMGLSERSLGRPKDWSGNDQQGFEEFAFRLTNWLSSLPGKCDELMEEAAQSKVELDMDKMAPRLHRACQPVLGSILDCAGFAFGSLWGRFLESIWGSCGVHLTILCCFFRMRSELRFNTDVNRF